MLAMEQQAPMHFNQSRKTSYNGMTEWFTAEPNQVIDYLEAA